MVHTEKLWHPEFGNVMVTYTCPKIGREAFLQSMFPCDKWEIYVDNKNRVGLHI